MTPNTATSNHTATGKQAAGHAQSLLLDTVCPILFVACAICSSALVSQASRVEAGSTTEYTFKGILVAVFILTYLMGVYYVVYKFRHVTELNLDIVVAGYAVLDVVTIFVGLNSLKQFMSLNPVANLLIVIAVNSWASTTLTCVPCPEGCIPDAFVLNDKKELSHGVDEEKATGRDLARYSNLDTDVNNQPR